MQSNLVIVGNGFDLACGLQSTYSEFFKDRISDDVENQLWGIKDSIVARASYKSINFEGATQSRGMYMSIQTKDYCLIQEADLTFWDLLFYFLYSDNNKTKEWHNIEKNILEILQNIKFEVSYSNLGRSIDRIPTVNRNIQKENTDNALRVASILANLIFPNIRYNSKKNIDEFLQSELILFETAFSLFLQKKLKGHTRYNINARNLLSKIISRKFVDDGNYSILSFNYTVPKCFKDNVTNVHGRLDRDNIIFGVDQKEIEASSPIYKYTKTYRKLIQNKKLTDDAIYMDNKSQLKNIYFYGHSLSSLDYSYFQSIFDYYNLYQSDVSLTFCCSKYGDKTSSEVMSEHANLVGQLLEQYGRTMTNKNHGKNLLHKLLLEGRLTIKEI